MKEVTFKELNLLEQISIADQSVAVNDLLLMDIDKIEIVPVDELLTYLEFKNATNQLIASLSVGSTERLLVNSDWSYIKKV